MKDEENKYSMIFEKDEIESLELLIESFLKNHDLRNDSDLRNQIDNFEYQIDEMKREIESDEESELKSIIEEIEIRRNQIDKLKSIQDDYKYYLYHSNDLYDENNKNDFRNQIEIEIEKSEKLLKENQNKKILLDHKDLSYKESDFQIEYSEDDRRINKNDRRIDWESEKNLKI